MTIKHCVICGASRNKSSMFKITNGFVCRDCLDNRSYSTRNNEKHNKTNKNLPIRFGFELECVPKDLHAKAEMLNPKYGLIATRDASLPANGVEFKTPIYQSFRGVKKSLRTFEKLCDFSSPLCGSHINMSWEGMDNSDMDVIRLCAPILFKPLRKKMESDRATTIKVCGRYFVDYARTDVPFDDHCSWINLSHNNRIEFRISKFGDADQYFALAQMWAEVMMVLKNLVEYYYHTDYRKFPHRVGVTANKIVRIYEKYADEKANCFRAERNTAKV